MLKKCCLLVIGILLTCFAATQAGETLICSSELHSMRIGIRHIENKGIGYSDGYTTVETFLAIPPELWPVMPFVDLRGHVFNDGHWAVNTGIGLRGSIGKVVYGGNIYYDYRNTSRKNYNQISFGLEVLSKWIDGRINGYFPFGTKITAPYDLEFNNFSGHFMYVKEKFQYALTGGNGEIGLHLPSLKLLDSYLALGPYYLIGKLGTGIWGGEARLNLNYQKCISFDLIYSYDKVFKNIVQAQIGLNFSFGPKPRKKTKSIQSCSQTEMIRKRMLAPVNKFEIIPVNTSTEISVALNPATDLPYYFVFVNNTSSSLGTYESPYPTLALSEENSSPGDILYIFPGNGTTQGMDTGITLKAEQKLWGSGTNHIIQTVQGLVNIPTQSSSTPQITNITLDENAITLAINNDVSGLALTDVVGHGIIGIDPQNIEITSCTIGTSQFDKIHLEYSASSGTILLDNLTLTNGEQVGISVTSTSSSLITCTVSNCSIQNIALASPPILLDITGPSTLKVSNNFLHNNNAIGYAPIHIVAGSSPMLANITHNTITNNTRGGIAFVLKNTELAQLIVANNIITNNDTGSAGPLGAPILIDPSSTSSGNCNLILVNNTISDNLGSAVYCSNGSFNNFRIDAVNNIITGNRGAGFVFDNPCNTLLFAATDNIISNGKDHGITTQNQLMDSVTMNLTHNQINNNVGDVSGTSGVVLAHRGNSLNFIATDNSINNNDSSGILMYSTNIITDVSVAITNNTITNNQNLNNNSCGGIDLDTFNHLSGSITNNILLNNATAGVFIGSTNGVVSAPSVCLKMSGNTNNTDPGYILDAEGGTFNLTPSNVESINTGTFSLTGVSIVSSCP